MKVRDLLAERPYVLKEERSLPKEERTIFWIKGLPYDVQIRVQTANMPKFKFPGTAVQKGEAAVENAEIEVDSAAQVKLEFDILANGLVRVENLKNAETGEVITYPQGASENALKAWLARWLPPAVRTELANAIYEGSVWKEDELKN